MPTPFQFFAAGLLTGILLQGLGLALHCRWPQRITERLPKQLASRLPRAGRVLWLCGVALLLAVAVYDRDVTLFAGQVLAAGAFWKMGWA